MSFRKRAKSELDCGQTWSAQLQAKLTKDKPFCFSVITTMAEPVAGMIDLNAFIDQMRGGRLVSSRCNRSASLGGI